MKSHPAKCRMAFSYTNHPFSLFIVIALLFLFNMRKLFFVFLAVFVTLATFFVSCNQHVSPSAPSTEIEEICSRLTEYRIHRKYYDAFLLIDSAERVGIMSNSMANGERGCQYAENQQFSVAEPLLFKAVNDRDLKHNFYHTYLNYADFLVYTRIKTYKYHEALTLAQQVCNETRYSNSLPEQLAALQMYAYIGSCNVRLHNSKEGHIIGDNIYLMCKDYENLDTIAAEKTFMAIITMLEANIAVDNWMDMDTWSIRAFEQLDKVPQYRLNPDEYDHWAGYLYYVRSMALNGQGRKGEADEAFEKFSNTRFSQGLGGLNAVYYLAQSKQWERIEPLLPRFDSLHASFGYKMLPEVLDDRYSYAYKTYRNLGRNEKALAVADSVFYHFREAIKNSHDSKATELAVMYEAQEKERELKEKDSMLSRVWTGSIAGVLVLMVGCLFVVIMVRRRSELRLKEEHQKLVEAYDQLMVANSKAEESSKMKSMFIKQISHEIRTPLNILSGFTQVLTNPNVELDSNTKADACRSIQVNTTRITKLVSHMLDLSDISSRSVVERTDKVSVRRIGEQAIIDSEILHNPSVKFSFSDSSEAGEQVILTHSHSAVRALTMLLNNAQKFLGKPHAKVSGTVTLSVELDHRISAVQFIVEDTGIGVPPYEAEHIFDEFVQLNNCYDGTGIGLTVARNSVRRIGGEIFLDTTYQTGARFVMSLPL